MGEGGSLNAIAYASTGVDFEAIESTVNQTIATTVTVSVCLLHLRNPCLLLPKKTMWDTCWKGKALWLVSASAAMQHLCLALQTATVESLESFPVHWMLDCMLKLKHCRVSYHV